MESRSTAPAPQRTPSGSLQQSPEEQDEWSGNDSDNVEDVARKRKRPRPMSVSCELCKQRKVKCDRGQPCCGWCLRNSQRCEYKERKKPGLRAGYGRELEARLDRLEDVLLKQQNSIDNLTNHASRTGSYLHQHPQHFQEPRYHNSQPSIVPPVLPSPQPSRADSTPYPQKPLSLAPIDLGGDGLRLPSITSSSHDPHIDQFERMSRSSTGAVPSDATYARSHTQHQSPSLSIPVSPKAGLRAADQSFPPYDLLYSLTDLYFKHVNPWCPILHRRSTLDLLFGSSELEEPDRILLHAIVATTLRFSSDPRLTSESRGMYYEHSKQRVLLHGMQNSSVRSIQAMVILALDFIGSSNGPPGWNIIAIIARSVVQIGLSVETSSPTIAPQNPSIYTLRATVLPDPKDWIEDESRRRLFWMIYVLDRYATVATAFEFALDEKEMDRKLPCREDFFTRNESVDTKWFRPLERSEYSPDRYDSLGPFSYFIEIIGLLSRIHQFLKRPVDINSPQDVEKWQTEYKRLDDALTNWKYSLPQVYTDFARSLAPGHNSKSSPNVDHGWAALHAAYNTTVIRLHSSAAYPTTRSPIFTPSYSASQRCHGAVESIVSLVNCLKPTTLMASLGPHFAFSIWVASRVLLVHASTISQSVDPSVFMLLSSLRSIGTHWPVAGRYAALLGRVLDEFSDAQNAPPSVTGERPTPSSVRILADMRRCAYDLDLLISRQPRPQAASRLASVTPTRSTHASELEYLDVFDFFNMPRLPAGTEVPLALTSSLSHADGASAMESLGSGSEFNIVNFAMDANADWFLKSQG